MAHEVGHNLGMVHDDKAGCAKEGFIMSPTRGSSGETEWSECSADLLRKGVGHGCLLDLDLDLSNSLQKVVCWRGKLEVDLASMRIFCPGKSGQPLPSVR